MEQLHLFLVILSGIGALLFLCRKWIFKRQKTKDSGCGNDCGCH